MVRPPNHLPVLLKMSDLTANPPQFPRVHIPTLRQSPEKSENKSPWSWRHTRFNQSRTRQEMESLSAETSKPMSSTNGRWHFPRHSHKNDFMALQLQAYPQLGSATAKMRKNAACWPQRASAKTRGEKHCSFEHGCCVLVAVLYGGPPTHTRANTRLIGAFFYSGRVLDHVLLSP